jgi:hypothetical protein
MCIDTCSSIIDFDHIFTFLAKKQFWFCLNTRWIIFRNLFFNDTVTFWTIQCCFSTRLIFINTEIKKIIILLEIIYNFTLSYYLYQHHVQVDQQYTEKKGFAFCNEFETLFRFRRAHETVFRLRLIPFLFSV